ncbi:MAG TPA: nuclease-related domain-containing protein [Methanocorpusculum sp.]|nr:nuclease-related domain-containing protein [Methanocorpusculum sp.]
MPDSADDIRFLTRLRGEEEEALLRAALTEIGKSLSSPYFSAGKSVFIPVSGGFAETDALFICSAGIFVFECKHMKGRVLGRSSDRLWTKTGESVLSFPNPVLQSRRHADAAAAYFGVSRRLCYSFAVVNDGCVLEAEADAAVLRTGSAAAALRPLIAAGAGRIDESALAAFISRAEKLSTDEKARKQHEAQIERMKKERRGEKKRG